MPEPLDNVNPVSAQGESKPATRQAYRLSYQIGPSDTYTGGHAHSLVSERDEAGEVIRAHCAHCDVEWAVIRVKEFVNLEDPR